MPQCYKLVQLQTWCPGWDFLGDRCRLHPSHARGALQLEVLANSVRSYFRDFLALNERLQLAKRRAAAAAEGVRWPAGPALTRAPSRWAGCTGYPAAAVHDPATFRWRVRHPAQQTQLPVLSRGRAVGQLAQSTDIMPACAQRKPDSQILAPRPLPQELDMRSPRELSFWIPSLFSDSMIHQQVLLEVWGAHRSAQPAPVQCVHLQHKRAALSAAT